jgi:hypothetical protein
VNPIEAAVMPLKEAAVDRAEQEAKKLIATVLKRLEEAGWDIAKVAPRASPQVHGYGNAYHQAASLHTLYSSVTASAVRRVFPTDPDIRKASPEAEARFIKGARHDAAVAYVGFVAKLVMKIGTVDSASLVGSHVWGYSVLTVAKADGSVERWKTQQIVNVSKLGKLFNQWPSRKVK